MHIQITRIWHKRNFKIIITPLCYFTAGVLCLAFSVTFRKPEGLFLKGLSLTMNPAKSHK